MCFHWLASSSIPSNWSYCLRQTNCGVSWTSMLRDQGPVFHNPSAGIIKSLEWTVLRNISLDGVPAQDSLWIWRSGGRKKPRISSESKAHVCLLHVGAGSIRRKTTNGRRPPGRERCRNREAGPKKSFTVVRNNKRIGHSLGSNRNYSQVARKKRPFITGLPSLLVTYSEPISCLPLV